MGEIAPRETETETERERETPLIREAKKVGREVRYASLREKMATATA
jgi:hypothetical protein